MTNISRTLTLVFVAMLLAAACSDNGGSSDGSSDGSTTPVAPGPVVTFTTQPPVTTAAAPTQSTGTQPTGTQPTSAPETPVPLGDPAIVLTGVASVDGAVDLAWRAGDPTMFVVGQSGLIVPMRDGQVGEPVLDMTDLTQGDGERGLLGLTFSPDGATAYVDHTDNDGDTVIASYAVGADGVFDAASRVELLTIDQPYANHNGGNVMIGPDGMLYIGMGDGGAAGDPERRALNVTSYLGKILRIDPLSGSPYGIPADNPFVDVPGALPEIWSVGVRNPWRMSFDPATGDLWFGDVGQNEVEEIDVAWAADGGGRGMNFGWSAFEGSKRYNNDQAPDGVTPPIFEYVHGDAGCSVSGGTVYRGQTIPALVGWYVFGDYCSGNVYAIRAQDRVLNGSLTLANQPSLSAVRAGPDGELYVLSVDGTIARVDAG